MSSLTRSLLLAVLSCVLFGGAVKAETYVTPVETEQSVTTGENVLVEGSYSLRDVVALTTEVRSTIPGSMMIPFSFRIGPGDLTFRNAAGGWEYYCASAASSGASFPGLGSVVAEGDCVGVRRRVSDHRLEWVVDNSNHNGMSTIWSRSVRSNELQYLIARRAQTVSDVALRRLARFDGYYSGLLHFTYEEGNDRRELVFDYSGSGEKLIGMMGRRMLVLGADSVGLRYRWIH